MLAWVNAFDDRGAELPDDLYYYECAAACEIAANWSRVSVVNAGSGSYPSPTWDLTLDPEGRPQPTPVWFLWGAGGDVVLQSRPRTAKLRNVRRNEHVAVHLNSARSGGDVVVLTGTAVVDDAGLTPAERAAYDEKYG